MEHLSRERHQRRRQGIIGRKRELEAKDRWRVWTWSVVNAWDSCSHVRPMHTLTGANEQDSRPKGRVARSQCDVYSLWASMLQTRTTRRSRIAGRLKCKRLTHNSSSRFCFLKADMVGILGGSQGATRGSALTMVGQHAKSFIIYRSINISCTLHYP